MDMLSGLDALTTAAVIVSATLGSECCVSFAEPNHKTKDLGASSFPSRAGPLEGGKFQPWSKSSRESVAASIRSAAHTCMRDIFRVVWLFTAYTITHIHVAVLCLMTLFQELCSVSYRRSFIFGCIVAAWSVVLEPVFFCSLLRRHAR